MMKYCADTWYMLALFAQDATAIDLMSECRLSKGSLIIPLTVFAETSKKLMQKGVLLSTVLDFLDEAQHSNSVMICYPDKRLAIEAARISLTYAVPMLDAFVAATCKLTACHLLLSADSDFQILVKKKYLKTRSW